jgi:hypothetical protein
MSRIATTYNEFGTRVTQFGCEYCGAVFTVCPEVSPENDKHWKGCLAKGCQSYNPNRDADKFFVE